MVNINDYFKQSSEVIKNLVTHKKKIESICEEILKNNKRKKKILVAGNGGSCADAEHFVGELQCTFKDRSRAPISAISLATMSSALTAWCNDFEFLSFYKRQVQAHGEEGDILFLISTGGGDKKSGASMSLVKAAEEGKKKNMKIISLVGKTGGELKKISDIFILVENKTTSFIQEAHMSILHCICEGLDNSFVNKKF